MTYRTFIFGEQPEWWIGTWIVSLILAFILCGCNTDTMNILWPTYEYQPQDEAGRRASV